LFALPGLDIPGISNFPLIDEIAPSSFYYRIIFSSLISILLLYLTRAANKTLYLNYFSTIKAF
jgi:hypothetical protein